ncbi:LPS-assembly protein [Devosia sp. YR412]|uniref:LPS-assembly protein LptD n=1 Tax=Devosia sp. YR412 TaxID=1881030 RepID=UPI0008C84DE1|nr:LPS assembly protein LptD [Devosia sp. YR412]SEP72326.1 LPS-assembly protein [Devosia sp. YR412]
MAKRGISPHRLALASALLALTLSTSAFGQGLVPQDFFSAPVDESAPIGVDADTLTFDSVTNVITASGNVVLRQSGYTLTGAELVYDRNTKDLTFVGGVTILDPSGNLAEMVDLKVTGAPRQAFLNAITLTSYDGARITADSVDYDAALQTLLEQATYAPCGDCIDDNGNRIGWSVKATRIVYNAADGSTALDNPTLELLGVPVAWLPYLWLPNLQTETVEGIRMPTYDYSEKTGHRVVVPYQAYRSKWTDVILTPTFMTRQGFLLGAEVLQRFDTGSIQLKASGIRQFDNAAFVGDGQQDWRGAIQTSGEFVPLKDWTVGWSYSTFSDPSYLYDYRLDLAKSSINQVYTTNLTRDTYFDVRVQQFNQIGENVQWSAQAYQATAVPAVRYDHVERLAPGFGQVDVSARLLGVQRKTDHTATSNGVPYVFGYAGNKQHASLQAGWQNQYVGAGGFVATPYLGGRADVAYYDGTSPILPGATTLWSATPIAAMDVRYPMVANDGSTVHLIEPIAQLVYRGSDTSMVGITNDDAQSFVFDDTNLFSYNRFSGNDRQETGLRLNVGGRYMANFSDNGYVELIAGQSFHLAGVNAFATADHAQTAVGGGLSNGASYAVLGAYAGLEEGIKAGGKLQVDTTNLRIARASLTGSYAGAGYTASVDYSYLAANPAVGAIKDQHEIGASVSVPVAQYWSIRGNAYWDLVGNSYLQFGGGVTYDDGYLMIGADATRTGPTHSSPNSTSVTASFKIKAPAGLDLGYAGAVPVPSFQ